MTTAATTLNATTLGCSITCKDLASSLRWYADVLGLRVEQSYEHEGRVVAAVVAAGDLRIMCQFLDPDGFNLGVSTPLAR